MSKNIIIAGLCPVPSTEGDTYKDYIFRVIILEKMEINADTCYEENTKWIDGHCFEHMITHPRATVKYLFDRTA